MSQINTNCTNCENLKKALSEILPVELKKIFREAYEEAGMSGLCHEGRLEYALDSINSKEISKIIDAQLNDQSSCQ